MMYIDSRPFPYSTPNHMLKTSVIAIINVRATAKIAYIIISRVWGRLYVDFSDQ